MPRRLPARQVRQAQGLPGGRRRHVAQDRGPKPTAAGLAGEFGGHFYSNVGDRFFVGSMRPTALIRPSFQVSSMIFKYSLVKFKSRAGKMNKHLVKKSRFFNQRYSSFFLSRVRKKFF